jgi:hypothetical protein
VMMMIRLFFMDMQIYIGHVRRFYLKTFSLCFQLQTM